MSNNDINRAFIELKALSQKKGYLLFVDLEKGAESLSLNEVDRLTNYLLNSGVKIFDDVSARNNLRQGNPSEELLFLKYKALKATGKMVVPKGFVVCKGSEYNEIATSSCTTAIDNKRHELMKLGKMKNGVLTEDVLFGSPSTAAKVLIGNSVNGNILWVDSDGNTLKQILAENEKKANGE